MIKMLHFATILAARPANRRWRLQSHHPPFLRFDHGGHVVLLIAPQRKKQKEQQKMISSLSAGDEVLLAGGIYGEITSVRPDRLVVRIGDNTKVEVEKAFIHTVVRKSGQTGDQK